MKRFHLIGVCLLLVVARVLAQSNPVPLINLPLVPSSVIPGGQAFVLTVNGTGFVPGSVVNWNGSPRSTSFVSASVLTASILASDVTSPGTAWITISNPATAPSNIAFLDITTPNAMLTFTDGVSLGGGAVAVGDFNGDQKLDFATLDTPFPVGAVFVGNGDGTFNQTANFSCMSEAWFGTVGDFNGDGKLDLVYAGFSNSGDGDACIFLGNGDGTFQPQVDYPVAFYPTGVTVGDFNGDGKVDIAVVNQCVDVSCNIGSVSILIGNGDGTFKSHVDYGISGSGFSIIAGDFNSDGTLDLAVSDESEDISILLGNGDGTFRPYVDYAKGDTGPLQIATADVNGDGKLDLLAMTSINSQGDTVMVLLGNGDGSFQNYVNYPIKGSDWLTLGDFDGDGKLDVASGSSIIFGNGDGTFQPPYSFGGHGVSLVAGDFNGDGRTDLVEDSVFLQSPVISFSPASLSFGSQNVGTNSLAQSVTMTNKGSATLVIGGITITGSNAVDFSQTNTCAQNLPAGGSCSIQVTFSPKVPGSLSAFLTFTDNAANSPQNVALSGTGVGAAAILSPASLDFGNQTVGIVSAPQVATLSNAGNINLTVSSIQLAGSDIADFRETNNCPTTIPPNGSCMITVAFNPSVTGSRTASVMITDNALNSPQSLPLMGVGVLPMALLSPTSLTFPIQVVFTTSPAQKVTLTNTGLGILKISGAAFTGQFGETNNCGSMLAPGASCSAEVSFKPKTKGTLNGTISLTDNAPGSPQKVSLTGIGTYLQITPAKINFGNQPVHTTSLAKTITISNKGTAQVTFSGISITGENGGDFAETNNCPTQLSSGSSCFVKVKFTPSKQGTRTANVSISDDGGGSPQTVPLTGTGTP